MNATYLGYYLDIHGGGMDIVFPIMRMRLHKVVLHPSKLFSYWIHNGFVTIDSEKMSKSLGNFFTIRQSTLWRSLGCLQQIRSQAALHFPQFFSSCNDIALHGRENVLIQRDQAGLKDSIPTETTICINKFQNECLTSMSDDLHTPVALAAMSEPLKTINDLLHTRKALQQLRNYALKRSNLTGCEVLQKMEERNDARKNKEYENSDVIRKDLADVVITLVYSPDGTSWKPTTPLTWQEQLTGS